jgi:plasmid stabilization system protein ParE
MAFEVLLDLRVHADIEKAIDYYYERSPKAANQLFDEIQVAYAALRKNPYFQVRYSDYRCLPLRIFPFMFHFTINDKEQTVYIHALINTSKNPGTSWLKGKKGK